MSALLRRWRFVGWFVSLLGISSGSAYGLGTAPSGNLQNEAARVQLFYNDVAIVKPTKYNRLLEGFGDRRA